MLKIQEFFEICTGLWKTERTYHYVDRAEIERSFTEFRVTALTKAEKGQILALSEPNVLTTAPLQVDPEIWQTADEQFPGFAIAFQTRSETGETLSMSLKALFVPDIYVFSAQETSALPQPVLPQVAEVPLASESDIIQGYYLRDEGYSEAGAIAGRFTYQPTRQTLEMTTYYQRSVAVDQMRIVAPDIRLRTILTYRRPLQPQEAPHQINLIGFGVEHRQPLSLG
ncbi:phycobiliprotein lyase [Oscillatoria amoena NRMC-F 0135]|nr:phycobiliprotein lyase [Geitlerinema splendidum]MDL5051724.1 phycobiliprotein lyase [Oscillatoria amoena NRMC-F 0135]